MVSISCRVASPIKTAIVIPNRKDILTSCDNWLHLLPEHFAHKRNEVLGWVAVHCHYFIALFKRELLHHRLDDCVGVVIKALEVMAEVAHDMGALEDALEEVVLASEIGHVALVRGTHVFVDVAADELVFEAVDGPSYVRWQCAVDLPVARPRPPNELCLVFEENVLV